MKLDVYLHGEPVGALSRTGDGYEFAYASEVVDRAEDGAAPPDLPR